MKYPHLPLELANLKIDLYVQAPHRTAIKGFTTAYAGPTPGGYLTRLFTYRPMSQVEDLQVTNAPDDRRINTGLSPVETGLRIGQVVAILLIVAHFIWYEKKYRSGRRAA